MINLITRKEEFFQRIDIFEWVPQIGDNILSDGIYGEKFEITDIFDDSYECKTCGKFIFEK